MPTHPGSCLDNLERIGEEGGNCGRGGTFDHHHEDPDVDDPGVDYHYDTSHNTPPKKS